MEFLIIEVTQESTNAPDVSFRYNPLGYQLLQTERLDRGKYRITFNLTSLPNDILMEYRLCSNKGDSYTVQTESGNQTLYIETFDSSGTLEDARLYKTIVKLSAY